MEDMKRDLKYLLGRYWLDSCGSEQQQAVGCCECGSEP